MIKVNFLTAEYKSKIFLRKFASMSTLLIILYVVAILAVNMSIQARANVLRGRRDGIVENIRVVRQNTVEKRKETEGIEDLTNKTQILEDILNQRQHGFSDVLFQLQENIPNNVWLTSLSYSGDTLIIRGIAGEDRRARLTSDKNLLRFERNLKETERYLTIRPEYSRAREVRGSRVQEFQYTITLSRRGM